MLTFGDFECTLVMKHCLWPHSLLLNCMGSGLRFTHQAFLIPIVWYWVPVSQNC